MLQAQIQNIAFKANYKKAYSMVNNALKQAIGDNVIQPRPGGWCENDINNANFSALKTYFSEIKDCGVANPITAGCWASGGDNFNTAPNSSVDSFVDASGVDWAGGEGLCGAIIVDVNGFTQPNQFGRDRFALMMGADTTKTNIDRISPWADQIAVEANECPRGSCYYSTWLLE